VVTDTPSMWVVVMKKVLWIDESIGF
jgi:hypothetical protein